MKPNKAISLALTYDDVLLEPRYSAILPHETQLNTRFSRRINLAIPFVSAAMDTVSEAKTAITMARLGGIGVIHKNSSPAQQASEVKKVKKAESGFITEPVTVGPSDTVAAVRELMEQHGISGFPVLSEGQLVGIITGRDLRCERDPRKQVSQSMTAQLITAPEHTSPQQAMAILQEHRLEKLPILTAEGLFKGLYTVKDIMNATSSPSAAKDSRGRLLVAAAIGASGDYLERAALLLAAGADALIIDTAHGHSSRVINAVAEIRRRFTQGTFEIIAGNIATAAGAQALLEAGVDGLKVGIGPGSICTTRIIAGVGVPQLTAVLHCAEVAAPYDIPLIADGGIKFSGDAVKALAAGAATVMLGSMLAGTDEAPGELLIYHGKSYKGYRGMGSLSAMADGQGSRDRYFQDQIDTAKLVPEGIEGRVSYKGPLKDTLVQLCGGLQQGMGYLGVKTIAELQEAAHFIQITAAGLRESHPHDVEITRESPNYKRD